MKTVAMKIEDTNMRIQTQLRKNQEGMTLVELMIALTILVIGMGGVMIMVVTAIAQNNGTKHDSNGTMLAQMVAEKFLSVSGVNPPPVNPVEIDCAGVAHTIALTSAAGPAGAGATLTAAGNIDFTQAFGGVPANYAMQFVACGNAGRQATYDVRWNVQTLGANTKLIIVAARRRDTGSTGIGFNVPVTVRTIAGL
jgi:prepilin-type N-terminal cleavage/methylation domain-containing protein